MCIHRCHGACEMSDIPDLSTNDYELSDVVMGIKSRSYVQTAVSVQL